MRSAALVAAVLLTAPACAGTAAPAASAPAAAVPTAQQTAAAAGSRAATTSGVMSLSLVEALAAIKAPQLAGLFSFIAAEDAPFAFADYLARDQKALKRYVGKLDEDRSVANGLTAWDHAVCANLVNLYSGPLSRTFGRPDDKRMSKVNQCVLSPVVPLEEIVARRKR